MVIPQIWAAPKHSPWRATAGAAGEPTPGSTIVAMVRRPVASPTARSAAGATTRWRSSTGSRAARWSWSARAWAAGSCCWWRSRGRSGCRRWSGSPRHRISPRICCCRRRARPSAAQLDEQGYWLQPSAYGDPPCPVTRALIEDGRRHLLLRAPIPIRCPVHLLHGQRDPDVPWRTALRLAERLESEDVTIELIKAGDHRLSTPCRPRPDHRRDRAPGRG